MASDQLHPVYSSHVDAVGYDPERHTLTVRWKTGKMSLYHDVPPEEGADLHKQASVGLILRDIKARYRHTYI